MVRQDPPQISRPLPVLRHGLQYDDISVSTRQNDPLTSKKPSPPYTGWLYSLWHNITSTNWVENLLPSKVFDETVVSEAVMCNLNPSITKSSLIRSDSGSLGWRMQNNSIQIQSPSRTLPELPKLIWPDWRTEDHAEVFVGSLVEEKISPVVDFSCNSERQSVLDDLLRDFVEDALIQADDLNEIDFWAAQFTVDDDLLWKAIDCNIFKVNPPAWETLAYLSGGECRIERIRKLYLEGEHNVKMLGTVLLASEIGGHRMSLALWRIWAYCIVSTESMIACDYIAVQMAWLRGPAVDRAFLGKAPIQ
ncbi:hypothetical protein ACMFMG_011728 [Clarireedia jacksonii]